MGLFRRARGAFLLVVLAVVTSTSTSGAQPCLVNCPSPPPDSTPEPTPEPQPTLTPPPQETPVPTPNPSAPVPPVVTPTPSPRASVEPTASPTPAPDVDLPGDLQVPEDFEIPVLARTPPRNTVSLVEILRPLTDYGVPLEQVLIDGMGRFPVAGQAFYSDDWFHPRYNPYFHLHHGLDIFADQGTPIRSPDDGVVTRMTTSPLGGIGAWVRGVDGTDYYFAHMLGYAEDLHVGMEVDIGTVIGYVGDTGNAVGGTPHVHFEVHRGGAIPPKPHVDRWLDEALELAPMWVDARIRQIEAERASVTDDQPTGVSKSSDLEANMLLTLIDPIGGSVGLLPRLDLPQPQRSLVSERLMSELVRLRLDGYVFAPGADTLRPY